MLYGKLRIGHLNVTGWTSTNDRLRKTIVMETNFDSLGLCETHIGGNDQLQIQLDLYIIYSHKENGCPIYIRGVALIIHKRILHDYKVISVEKFPGILSVELKNNDTNHSIHIAECYISPENSPYGRDPESVFNQLEEIVYEKTAHIDDLIILGDFNARTGKLTDYNQDVDQTVDQEILDETVNGHGRVLIDFLKDSKIIMLNGCFN